MKQIRDGLCGSFAIVLAAVALAALGLSACGSSESPSTATRANAAATVKTLRAKAAAAAHSGASGGSGVASTPRRFSALRTCLGKHGVQLPDRPRSELFLGGASLPKGVTRSQLQAAMRACLGGRGSFLARPGAAPFRRGSTRLRQALSAFAACMRKNGIAVPAPKPSGNGPVFSTKGLDPASPKFKAASAKCRSALIGALGLHGPRRPGSAQPTG